MDADFELGAEYAARRDEADPLAHLADRFYDPEDEWYVDGNSLGLLSEDAEEALDAAVSEWRDLAIRAGATGRGWRSGRSGSRVRPRRF